MTRILGDLFRKKNKKKQFVPEWGNRGRRSGLVEAPLASKISDDLFDGVGKLVMGGGDPVLGLDEAGEGSTGQADGTGKSKVLLEGSRAALHFKKLRDHPAENNNLVFKVDLI